MWHIRLSDAEFSREHIRMRRRGQTGFNLVTLLVQRGIKRRCEKYVFATDKTSLQIQDKFIWLKDAFLF